MKTRTMLSLGLSAMLFGGTMVGCTQSQTMLASAGTRDMTKAERHAADEARDATKLLAKGKLDKAVEHAEQAVAYSPHKSAYRALLGHVYMQAGRFTSAQQALADALTLDPANGEAALDLALAQTALGDWTAARATLGAHADSIAPADRGLALALAGDPSSAVQILGEAARAASADATTRQNFALALALDGKWKQAKAVAAVDLAPGEADKRIMEWAQFARPTSASDQVAALLGVVPVDDGGQPVRLALNDPATQLAAVAPVAPSSVTMPAAEPVAEAARSVELDPAKVAMKAPVALASSGPAITFAPRREIVQPLPQRLLAAADAEPAAKVRTKPQPHASKAMRALASGGYYVQLGAYENSAVAHDKWNDMRRHMRRLAGLTPSGMTAEVDGRHFYRLSVGGFARGDAVSLCREVRSGGGQCFVRANVGDEVASWVRGDVQLASR